MNEQVTAVMNDLQREVLSPKTIWGFALGRLSSTIGGVFVTFLTYYATDSLYLSAAVMGMVLMFSKFFDGFTDVVAGIIIDKTRTKFGKARPYALCGIPYWISMVLLFTVPNFPDIAKAIYIFIMYNLNISVFGTLVNCAKDAHLRRTIRDDDNRIKALNVSGIVYSIGTIVLNVGMPILVHKLGGSRLGWTAMALGLAIPGTLCFIANFLWCPEYPEGAQVSETTRKKINIKTSIMSTIHNKYLIIFTIVQFINMMVIGLSHTAGTYYFRWVVGNLSAFSIVSAASIVLYPFLPLIPKIVKKTGKIKFIQIGFICGAVGSILRAIAYKNVVFLSIVNPIASIGMLPLSFVGPAVLIDCMEYGEYRTGLKIESFYSAFDSFAMKVAGGISGGLLGFLLAAAGYSGALQSQPQSALNAINFLYNGVPAIAYSIIALLLIFFDLEKLLGKIRAEKAVNAK